MEKDTRLVNIYLKIHNKRSITLDDLRYLAQHDPECFEKTCKNVVYNLPQSRPIMEPVETKAGQMKHTDDGEAYIGTRFDVVADGGTSNASRAFDARAVLRNLKKLEIGESLFADVDFEQVKNLLGNLYMELLFPHNDEEAFFDVMQDEEPKFDAKA